MPRLDCHYPGCPKRAHFQDDDPLLDGGAVGDVMCYEHRNLAQELGGVSNVKEAVEWAAQQAPESTQAPDPVPEDSVPPRS